MKIYEIGTGYTTIPSKIGAATEIVVEELTHSMMKQNVDVTILDIKDKNRQSSNLSIIEVYMPQFFSSTDVKLGIMHKLKRVLYSISLSFEIIKILKSEKEKCILHFHNQYNLFFFLKIASKRIIKNVEIVYTNHSYIWFGNWNDIKGILRKKYFQEIFCLRHANKVFVLNKITVDHLINKLNIQKDKIVLIPNGVNVDQYKPLDINSKDLEEYRRKWKIEEKKVFIQVGSLCDRKNQLGTVEMMLPLLKNNRDLVLAFVGGIIDTKYFKSIFDLCKRENIEKQVLYLGEVSPGKELNIIYNIAKASIFNSKSEAFSLVILESLSAGTPILIDSDFLRRMEMLDSNSNGIIPYNSNSDLYFKIENEILNLENNKKHAQQGRSFIENKYSWDAITDLYIKEL